MKKQVGMVHLVYSIIISLIIITFISILAFGASPDAGNQMNVAATAISIILAVIAILMTLVDVAGQRQAMIDLKETADSLNRSNEVAQEMIEKSRETVQSFVNTKEALLKSVEQFKDETIQSLKDFQAEAEGGVDVQKFNELIQELEVKKDIDLSLINLNSKSEIKRAKDKKKLINSFTDWYYRNYGVVKKVPYNEFNNKLTKEFGANNSKFIMSYLMAENLAVIYPGSKGDDIVKFYWDFFDNKNARGY